MAYLSFALTIVLLVAFFYVVHGGLPMQTRRTGPVLVRLAARRGGAARTGFAVGGTVGLLSFSFIVFLTLNGPNHRIWGGMYVLSAINLVLFSSMFAQSLRGTYGGLEICQNGLVFPGARGLVQPFVPWGEIKYCKWNIRLGTLFVQHRFHIAECPIPPERADEVTAALAGKVEVRDASGNVIAPAPQPDDSTETTAALNSFRTLFQFRLSTLLLLVLVVSSASGFVGIIVHRDQKRNAAFTPIERFDPRVTYEGAEVVELRFPYKSGPGDKDLPLLREYSGLRRLQLAGPKITDAGLDDLAELTQLEHLDLRYTAVTADGVEKLRRRLPEVEIVR